MSERTALVYGALLEDVGELLVRGGSGRETTAVEAGAEFLAGEAGYSGGTGERVVELVRRGHAGGQAGDGLAPDSSARIIAFAEGVTAGWGEGRARRPFRPGEDPELEKVFNILNGRDGDATVEHEDCAVLAERLARGLSATPPDWDHVNAVLGVLEDALGRLPASPDLMDVSLFDYARTTAGIALCVHDCLRERGVTDYRAVFSEEGGLAEYREAPLFLLCTLDMSGIQDFIYTISGDGALKQLRARSLYLDLMMEDVVDELLERLRLCRANLLYVGGGNARLLLPNTAFVREGLERFRDDLGAWFVENYRTDLYMAIAWTECSADELANSDGDGVRHRALYQRLFEEMSARKANRYSAETIRGLNFADDGVADRGRECTECHRSDLRFDPGYPGDDAGGGKCALCGALGKISKRLVERDVFVVSEGGASDLPLPFGACLEMLTWEEYRSRRAPARRVYVKNDRVDRAAGATRIWMCDYTAPTGTGEEEDAAHDISDYAVLSSTLPRDESGRPAAGIVRLGVLRADVDNLGATFLNGIPPQKASLARTAALSRELARFFKYEMNGILEKAPYRLQAIYSGGDDLFLLGNWSDVLHAGMDIRREFREFTGGSLSISAGLGMFQRKYPIASMAEQAGELEEAAKHRRAPDSDEVVKDAVALWSEDAVFGWDEFVREVVPLHERIRDVIGGNEKGKAFLYKVLYLIRDSESPVSAPRLAYLLARSFEGVDGGDDICQELYRLAMEERDGRQLAAALEWYVYETRERR